MKGPIRFLAVMLPALLLPASANAQAEGDAGAGFTITDASVLRLTPPAPDGGVYGAGDPAPPAAEPSDTPPASTSGPPGTTAGTIVNPAFVPPPPPAVRLTEPLAPRHRPSLVRARLHLLNTMLPPLAERSRSQRIVDGVLSLVVGTGIGALSFVVPSTPGSDLRPWFWTFAGVSIASGVLTLAWVPARETLSSQFEEMPMRTGRQRRARVRFGEYALDEMAADGSRRRVLGALANVGVSVGMLGVIYRDPLFNGTPHTFGVFDYLVIGFTGISVVTSLIGLFTKSEEERMRDNYRRQIQIFRSEVGDSAP